MAPRESLQSMTMESRTVILFSCRNSIVSASESNASCDVTAETGKLGRNLGIIRIHWTHCLQFFIFFLLLRPALWPQCPYFIPLFSHKYGSVDSIVVDSSYSSSNFWLFLHFSLFLHFLKILRVFFSLFQLTRILTWGWGGECYVLWKKATPAYVFAS